MMRVLTLTQPWASLVAVGAKRVETRSWTTKYRGPLAIRAAKTFPKATPRAFCAELCGCEPFVSRMSAYGLTFEELPLGAIVAVGVLHDVAPVEECNAEVVEVAFGDYSPGRFAWLLRHVVPLREPVECDGGLGLRWASDELAMRVRSLRVPTNTMSKRSAKFAGQFERWESYDGGFSWTMVGMEPKERKR